MSSIQQASDNDQPRNVPEYEYTFAETIIKRVARAATDIVYRVALYETYATQGLAHLIPGLVRAIDEYRRNTTGVAA